jgi:thiol-disulfide isomerase/thioredoxin
LASCFPSDRSGTLALVLALVALAASAGEAPLAVEDAEGRRVELAPLPGGSALVVHFWASWCPECAEELPWLAEAAARCGDAVRVVPVNVGESRADAEDFLSRHRLPFPLLRDPDGREFRRFARGLPANVIWTRGERRVLLGPQRREAWQKRLAELGCAPRSNDS